MTTLTYAEIESLQHILNTAMFTLDDIPYDLYSLKDKLIVMRAELEYPSNINKTYYTLSSNGDITVNL